MVTHATVELISPRAQVSRPVHERYFQTCMSVTLSHLIELFHGKIIDIPCLINLINSNKRFLFLGVIINCATRFSSLLDGCFTISLARGWWHKKHILIRLVRSVILLQIIYAVMLSLSKHCSQFWCLTIIKRCNAEPVEALFLILVFDDY
jgi:hypothetical protein